jgi:archaellum component FlaC
MEDLTKHIDPMMKPFLDIEKITKPMTEFQKSLEKPLKDFQKAIENINKLIVSFSRKYRRKTNSILQSIQRRCV